MKSDLCIQTKKSLNQANTDDIAIESFMGVGFHSLDLDRAVSVCNELCESDTPSYVVTPNLDFLVNAQSDKKLQEILFYADLVLCDGRPLVWFSKFFGRGLPDRIAGSDLVPKIIDEAQKNDRSIYFMGSSDETLAELEEKLKSTHPKLRVAGSYSPPFGTVDSWDNDLIAENIRKSNADILMLALGSPKQEYWIKEYLNASGASLALGVGASLDFIVGRQNRCPAFVAKVGMEWIWRMAMEPRRLYKRYYKDLCNLPKLLWAQCQVLPLVFKKKGELERQVLSSPFYTWLKLCGDLDSSRLESIDQSVPADTPIVCDCRELAFVDSSGMGYLARLARGCKKTGHSFVLYRPPDSLKRLINLLKMNTVLPWTDNKAEFYPIFNRNKS